MNNELILISSVQIPKHRIKKFSQHSQELVRQTHKYRKVLLPY